MYTLPVQSIGWKNGLNLELIATEFILTVLNLENATNCYIKNLKKSEVRKSAKSKMASKMASSRYQFQGQIWFFNK